MQISAGIDEVVASLDRRLRDVSIVKTSDDATFIRGSIREVLLTLAFGSQSQQLYRDGFASFIDVLDSQHELNTSLQQLATAERNLSLAVVDLYSALGGSLPEV